MNAYASTLSKEEVPLTQGIVGQNQTMDQQDIDISVDPTESLPSNGTQEISTERATDIDINIIPPA
jgi:hypothetical protein